MRPKLNDTIREFKKVNISVPEVGTFIGGKVDYNINTLTKAQGKFENACAIRISYVLNNSGVKIPYIPGQTVSGKMGDGIYIK